MLNILHVAVRVGGYWKGYLEGTVQTPVTGAVEEGNFCSHLSWFPAIGNLWTLCSVSVEVRKVQSLAREHQPSQHISPTQGLAKRKWLWEQEESTSFPTQRQPLILPSDHRSRIVRGDHPEGPFWFLKASVASTHWKDSRHNEEDAAAKQACLSKAKPCGQSWASFGAWEPGEAQSQPSMCQQRAGVTLAGSRKGVTGSLWCTGPREVFSLSLPSLSIVIP